jgi:hypothetical protein
MVGLVIRQKHSFVVGLHKGTIKYEKSQLIFAGEQFQKHIHSKSFTQLYQKGTRHGVH